LKPSTLSWQRRLDKSLSGFGSALDIRDDVLEVLMAVANLS